MKVQEFLKTRDVPFEVVQHQPTFRAMDLAKTFDRKATSVVKTVLLQGESKNYLAVLHADQDINLKELRVSLDEGNLRLASEADCEQIFDDCEKGAVPPFGSHYGIETVMERSLNVEEKFIFEGNDHQEAFVINFTDYANLEKPIVASFARETNYW